MESQQGGSNLTEGQGDEPEDTDMAVVSFCWSTSLQPSEPGTRSGSIDVETVEAKLFSCEVNASEQIVYVHSPSLGLVGIMDCLGGDTVQLFPITF